MVTFFFLFFLYYCSQLDEGKEKAIKKWNEIFFLRCAVASRGYTLCVENDQSPGRKVDLLFTEGQVGEDRFHIVLSGEDFFFFFFASQLCTIYRWGNLYRL